MIKKLVIEQEYVGKNTVSVTNQIARYQRQDIEFLEKKYFWFAVKSILNENHQQTGNSLWKIVGSK